MSRRGWLLFGTLCLVWGVPYLLVKVAVEELSPAELVFGRCVLGLVVLLPFALRAGGLGLARRAWRPLALFAVLEMAGPWLLIGVAEQELSSSLVGLLVAAVPLVSAVVGRALGEADRLDRTRVAGLLVGVTGVGVLLGLDVRGGDLLSVAAVGLVVLGYATGPIVVTRALSHVPASTVNAVALGLTALLYLPFGGPRLAGPVPSGQVLLAVLALGVVCTAVALLVFFALIAEAGAQRALVITFVNPAVAVVLGIAVLSEPFTVGTAVGFPLVLLGCVLATRRSAAAATPQAAGEPVTVAP